MAKIIQMKRKKKISKLTLLRRENKQLLQKLAAKSLEAVRLQNDITTLTVQLNEARRRTIPLKGAGEVNFLPLYAESVAIDYETRDVESWGGERAVVQGRARVTIIAMGDLVQSR
jgi:hypothetical protein